MPPKVDPDEGLRFVSVGPGGGGVTYVYVWLPLVPLGVVTLTLTGPAAFAGALCTVICVSVSTLKHGADGQGLRSCVGPKFTSVAPVKLVPVRVTSLPPKVDPDEGLRFVSVGPGGGGVTYVYVWLPLVPLGVVTLTLTGPAAFAGALCTVICVSVSTLKHGADGQGLRSCVGPKFTSVAPVKLVPVRVTSLPPKVDPDEGLRFVSVGPGGGGVTYVYVWFPLVPLGVVTLTLTGPAPLAGAPCTVICVSVSTLKHGADGQGLRSCVGPKFTSVAPVKLVPVRVTSVPPKVDPDEGLRFVKVGAGGSTVSTSPGDVADVPPGVVTSVSYCPAAIEFGRLIVRSVSSVARKQFACPLLAHTLVMATVEPPPVGTRSTSLTPLTNGETPGYEKLVPVTGIPVAPWSCGLPTTLATVGGSKYE